MKVVQIDFDDTLCDSSVGFRKIFPDFDESLYKTFSYNADICSKPIQSRVGMVQPDDFDSNSKTLLEAWKSPIVIQEEGMFPFDWQNVIEDFLSQNKDFRIVIRSISLSEEVAKKKKQILQPLLNNDRLHFESILKTAEEESIKLPIDCDYYIDDYMENFIQYNPKRTELFLIDRYHNQEIWNPRYDYSCVTRVKDIKEVFEIITKESLKEQIMKK